MKKKVTSFLGGVILGIIVGSFWWRGVDDYNSRNEEDSVLGNTVSYEEIVDSVQNNEREQLERILYMEFITGEREADGMSISDIAVPKGEPEKRYFTEYTFHDSDKDGFDELHVRSSRYYYIIDCNNNDLHIWKGLHPRTELLNNGDYLYQHTGGGSLHYSYKYFMLDVQGEEICKITFSWCDKNDNSKLDDKDIYVFEEADEISYETWEELTYKYLNVGSDKISWITLVMATD